MIFVQSLFLKSQPIWLSIMDKITRDKTLEEDLLARKQES